MPMIPTSIIAKAGQIVNQQQGVFGKLSNDDNNILGRQLGDEDLQFPQDLGDNEYNQFILFTSYETAGSKISAQARSKRREELVVGEDLDIASDEAMKLVAEKQDLIMYEKQQSGDEDANFVFYAPELDLYRPEIDSTVLQQESDEALREVEKLTTRKTEATAGAEEAEAQSRIPRLSAGRNHEDFINDRSRSTIEQQKLLGIERRVSSEGRMRLTSATSKSNTNIALYLPNKLVNSGTIGYNNVEFELIQAGASVINEIGNGDAVGAALAAAGIGSRIAASIVDGIASVGGINPNASAALQQVTGLAINPRQQQIFQGVQTRGFDFTFSFAPKNQKEAVEVSKIIRAFRKLSHPSISHGAFLNVPDEFEIRYYKVFNNGVVAENLFLNKIGRCALTAVNVDYTPNGINATFPDGSPVRTSLTMQFTELRPLVREDIEEGY